MKSSQNRSVQCPMEMKATAAGRSLRQSEVYQLRERWDKPSPRHRSYRQRRPPSRTARSRKRPAKRPLTTSGIRSKQLTASIEASDEIILRGSERWAYLSAHRRQRNIRARCYFPDRRSRLSRGFPWLVVTLKPLIRKKVRGGLAFNSGCQAAVCITSR